mgnify:CR=1 FL=1
MRAINLSNHPSTGWSPEQSEGFRAYTAELTGKAIPSLTIEDQDFPAIDPEADEAAIRALAAGWITAHKSDLESGDILALHLMGETSFVCELTRQLTWYECVVLCSTTHREVVPHPDGRKTSVFRFVRFRQIG